MHPDCSLSWQNHRHDLRREMLSFLQANDIEGQYFGYRHAGGMGCRYSLIYIRINKDLY
jgi:hypothetical protein